MIESFEAEINVISFLFSEFVEESDKEEVLQLLEQYHFSDNKMGLIYNYIKDLKVFDRLVLWDKICSYPEVKPNGIELSYLKEIDSLVTCKEARSYVEIILDKYQKRQVYSFAKEMQTEILKGGDQFEIALRAQQVLSSIASKSKIEKNVDILDRVLNEKPEDVLSTGYRGIDRYLGGYARGMIITIAGDSGHLKTTLALDTAFRMAEINPSTKIGIFSKEMLAGELVKKQISRICGIPTSKIFSQEYDKEFVKKEMMKIPAWRDDRIKIISPNLFTGIPDIARIQSTERFDIWFLDFIQLLEFSRSVSSSSDYNVQVGQNMRNLQSLALMTKSVGVVLSQVKKGIEYREIKKPSISDIEWSGLIKQLSSYIFFSYYPGKYYGWNKMPKDHYYLLGEKTRFAETFTYPMMVDAEHGRFEEILDPLDREKMFQKLKSVVGASNV